MSKYQLVLRCKNWRCQHKYKRTVEAADDEAVKLVPNPPCPKCSKKPERRDAEMQATPPLPHDGVDFENRKAPGLIGNNVTVKAIDMTAEIVMRDHNLTNLRDDVRQGETMAPRLAPAMQQAADNMFKPGAGSANPRKQAMMKKLAARALQGGLRHNAVDLKSILPDSRVALRKVGTEQINRENR